MNRNTYRGGVVMAAVLALLWGFMGFAFACGHQQHHTHVQVAASFTDQACANNIYTTPTIDAPDVSGTTVVVTGTPAPGAAVDVKYTPNRGVVIDGQSEFTHTYPSSPTPSSCKPAKPKLKHGAVEVLQYSRCTANSRRVVVTARVGVDRVRLTHGAARYRWVGRIWMKPHTVIRTNPMTNRGPWVHHTKFVVNLPHVPASQCNGQPTS